MEIEPNVRWNWIVTVYWIMSILWVHIKKGFEMRNSGIIWRLQHELQCEQRRERTEEFRFGDTERFNYGPAADNRREPTSWPQVVVYRVENWWGSSWESLWRKVILESLLVNIYSQLSYFLLAVMKWKNVLIRVLFVAYFVDGYVEATFVVIKDVLVALWGIGQ